MGIFIGTAVYIDDVESAFSKIQIEVILAVGLLVLLTIGLSFVVGLSITRPLDRLWRAHGPAGRRTARRGHRRADRKDEIGKMAQTVFVFRQNAREMRRLETEQLEPRSTPRMSAAPPCWRWPARWRARSRARPTSSTLPPRRWRTGRGP